MASHDEIQALLANVTKSVTDNSQSGDPQAYDDALAAILKLQLAVEKPGDFAARIRFQGLQNTALVMLAEMGVLQAIAATPGKHITASTLARDSDCDEQLIVRLMRTITAVGVCDETGVHTYRSNRMTEVLATSGQRAGMQFMVDLQFHIGSRIRDYMRETGFHKTGSSSLTACQFAFGKSFWRILDENAEERANFNEYMKAARRGGQVQLWHERYPPVKSLAEGSQLKTGSDDVLMVDVGGGVGGQVGALRKQYPDLPGLFVLQDLPDTIKNNPAPPQGVNCMAYDFFTPQPIKGARIYLFRSVCHDWDDEKSIELLRNTVDAMDPSYSRLLIDEWVLPDMGVSQKSASMDCNMMLLFNASERTKMQWEKMLDAAGLEIVDIFSTPGAAESVIETKLKERNSRIPRE